MHNPEPIRRFVRGMTECVERAGNDEAERMARARPLLQALIARDDWLPDVFATPHPDHYQQYLLHCDPLERFSLVSFVWGPGQRTPIHDHTVWGLVGMLRGGEECESFELGAAGKAPRASGRLLLQPGDIEGVSPTIGDIHRVSNAHDDRVSISIHVYGANIGAVHRHVYDAQTGEAKRFVSGYASPYLPNLWDRSRD